MTDTLLTGALFFSELRNLFFDLDARTGATFSLAFSLVCFFHQASKSRADAAIVAAAEEKARLEERNRFFVEVSRRNVRSSEM